ncbi:MAG: 4-hydroxy-3-methylbut-2-en-1-yl diphosphate synthase [Phycisphaeraceae bacterium]|nr:4-hydroxy-3-methylbut-2-en-1-yl diphosphate synthase [Phycisphaeraceae bacterium]
MSAKHSLNHIEDFRAKIRSGGVCLGAGITFHDPAVTELIGDVGFDFVWIDGEHGPMGLEAALCHVMAARGTGAASLLRVRCCDPDVIKPFVDLAPAIILVPRVNTAEQARVAVSACRYPPAGERGFGPRRSQQFGIQPAPDYLAKDPDTTMVMVQIEHEQAVRNLDEILAVEGLAGVCVGPNDLSGSYGKLGQIDDPEVAGAIDAICAKTLAADKYLGVATGYKPDTVDRWIARGFHWISYGVDHIFMARAAEALRNDFDEAVARR